MTQIRKMPKRADILEYWYRDLIEKFGKSPFNFEPCPDTDYKKDKIERESLCFACESMGAVQRCHIIPKHLGGSDGIENIHLLCRECHLESEYLETHEVYFAWFMQKNTTNSGSLLRQLNLAKLYEGFIAKGRLDLVPEYVLKAIPKNILDEYSNKKD